jgi:tetratricopeptide (TPR) repeat protein
VFSSLGILTLLALLGWVPLVLLSFLLLPARRAMVAGAISAWLLLPPIAIDLPGLPAYGKSTAATIGILLGTLIFEPVRLTSFRVRWFDLPMILWSLCPLFSATQNNLGLYDGLSSVFRQVLTWFLPYLIGRIYLTDVKSLRELAVGMIIGGMCLVLPCFFEVKMSAMLQPWVYGTGGWEGTRFGGYRPRVFFRTGLELGLWMNAVTLVAWWLWRTGQLSKVVGVPGGTVFGTLLVTALVGRSTGAIILFFAGLGSLWFCWRKQTKRLLWALLCVAPIYYSVRIPDLWSGRHAVALIESTIGQERADSLRFRLETEELLIAKALQQPYFGWGGWGRQFIYDQYEHLVTPPDGLWIIAFGAHGFFGLATMTLALLLPSALFLRRFPVQWWAQPELAPVTVFAVILTMYMFDNIVNAMPNVIYIIALGGLANITANGVPGRAIGPEQARHAADLAIAGKQPAQLPRSANSSHNGEMALTSAASSLTHQQRLGVRYRQLGRALKNEGDFAQAKSAWLFALDLLGAPRSSQRGRRAVSKEWCDCANDLAWLMVSSPDPAVRNPAHAVALASKAVEAFPENGTFWNTLGAAHYRAGEFEPAIAAINCARELNAGGTPFDHLVLAMAYARLDNHEQARHWLEEAAPGLNQGQMRNTELLRLRDEASALVPTVPEASAAP